MSSTPDKSQISDEVGQWLQQVVIGLNLCPFAAKPQRNQQIRIFVSEADTEDALLQDIFAQLMELALLRNSVIKRNCLDLSDSYTTY